MSPKLQPYYSGKLSRPFWRRVNRLTGARHPEAYSLGCALQTLEGFVLRCLHNNEEIQKFKARKRR